MKKKNSANISEAIKEFCFEGNLEDFRPFVNAV